MGVMIHHLAMIYYDTLNPSTRLKHGMLTMCCPRHCKRKDQMPLSHESTIMKGNSCKNIPLLQ